MQIGRPVTKAFPRAPRPSRMTTAPEVDGLREENAQLRDLVIQLSKLVIKNVVDRN